MNKETNKRELEEVRKKIRELEIKYDKTLVLADSNYWLKLLGEAKDLEQKLMKESE